MSEELVSAKIPGATTLFRNGWSYMLSRLDLIALLLVLPVVYSILALVLGVPIYSNDVEIPLFMEISSLIVSLGSIFIWVAVIYSVVKSEEQKISILESFSWAKHKGLGLIWVGILSSLVVMGGFILLIIPGIILSIYLYLAQYVYIQEGQKGLSALLRSRDLVKDNWMAIFGRVLLLGLMILLAAFVIGGVGGVAVALASQVISEQVKDFISFGIIIQLISAIATLIGVHAGAELYRKLAEARPQGTEPVVEGRTKYKALAWLALLSPVILVVIAIALFSLEGVVETLEKQNQEQSEPVNEENDFYAKERAVNLRLETKE
jgi:hypothetical protein